MSESTQPTFDAERVDKFVFEIGTLAYNYNFLEFINDNFPADNSDDITEVERTNVLSFLEKIFDQEAASILSSPCSVYDQSDRAIDMEYETVADILKTFLVQQDSMHTSDNGALDEKVDSIIGESVKQGVGSKHSNADFLDTLRDALEEYDSEIPTVNREINLTALYEAVKVVNSKIKECDYESDLESDLGKIIMENRNFEINNGDTILKEYIEFARGEGEDQVYKGPINLHTVISAAYLTAINRELLTIVEENTDNAPKSSILNRFGVGKLKSYLSNVQMPNLSEHIPDWLSISNLKSYLSNVQMPNLREHIPDRLSISNLKSYLSRNRTAEPVPTLDTVTEQVYQAEAEEPIVEPMPVVTEVTQTPRTPIDDYITRTATMGPEPTPEISPEDASFFAMADQYAAQETMESEVPFDYNPGPQIIGPVPTPEPIPEPIQQPTPINPDNTLVTDEDFVIEPVAIQSVPQVKLPYKNKAWRMYSRRHGNFGVMSKNRFNFLYEHDRTYLKEFLDRPSPLFERMGNTLKYVKHKFVA